MKSHYRFIFVPILVGILFSTATDLAADPSESFPNLIGKWIAENTVYLHTGQKTVRSVFDITEQNGPHFRGFHRWNDTHGGKAMATKKGKYISGDSEPIVGVIGFDGKSITIVEKDDLGTLRGKLIDTNTMQMISSEPGDNAMVVRMPLKRKP